MLQNSTKKAAASAFPAGGGGEDGNTTLDVILGQTLKTLRQRANMTQANVADLLEISPQQYQKYEKGASKCSLTTLYRLASHYGVRPEDLLPKNYDEGTGRPTGLQEAQVIYGDLPDQTVDKSGSSYAANANSPAPAGALNEASALAEILAIFIRIPNNETRRKILELLGDIF